MRHLLNTLFVTTEDALLCLDGENVLVKKGSNVLARFPLHNIEGIICFSYSGATPALMGKCAEENINLSFCTPNGKFLARISGLTNGNVLLRREQYRIADDEKRALSISQNMILGKLYNSYWVLNRMLRDHSERVVEADFQKTMTEVKNAQNLSQKCESMDSLRGIEGTAAVAYFDRMDDMILRDKEHFYFRGRNKRPPMDNVNALLSFTYSILANDCASALESVGLDSYVGFMHTDRPGRKSLALDIMEELRPCMADRFVLTLINNKIIQNSDFEVEQDGAVRLCNDSRKKFFKAWQEKKQETITHPFLGEKIAWGLVPYMQALLLSRYIRGDIEEYPPFLWK